MFKAVYIDRRELKCVCVGSSSNFSLIATVMMVAMVLWRLARMG